MNMNSPQILDPKLAPSLDYITEFKEKQTLKMQSIQHGDVLNQSVLKI